MIRMLVTVTAFAFLVAAPALAVAQSKASGQTSAKPAVTGTININTASATELQRLPGVGAKTAGRVIEYRQKNGPFKKVEELMNVQGIGEKSFLKLRTLVTVAPIKTTER